MNTWLIGYDLKVTGHNPQKYFDLKESIQALSTDHMHSLGSTWLIKSELTATQIRDRLAIHFGPGDELLIAVVSAPAAWLGFSESSSRWLREHIA